MTAVVTGASGHLGHHIVRALIEGGRPVRALVRRTRRGLDELGVDTVAADVCVADSLSAAFAGAHVVYHCAAMIALGAGQADLIHRVNVQGTRNVLAAARAAGVARVVHVSSAFVYDPAPFDVPVDEGRCYVAPARHSVYQATKIEAERVVDEAVAGGQDVVVVNPTSLIGAPDFAPSRAGTFLLDLFHRRLPALVTGGFDWVDVRDAAVATLAAADRGRRGERYILGGQWRSLRQLAEIAAAVTGRRPPRLQLPVGLASLGVPLSRLAATLRRREPRVTRAALRALRSNAMSSDKARRELGLAVRPLRTTVADFYRWAAASGAIDWRSGLDPEVSA